MRVFNLYGAGGRKNHVRNRVVNIGRQLFGQNLTIMHDSGCRRSGGDAAQTVEHAPFGIEETMPLAETDPFQIDAPVPVTM